MDFTFEGFQEDFSIKREENGNIYLEAYFDFEIEGLDQDEMRVGKVTIPSLGEGKNVYFFYDNEYDYTSIQEEVEDFFKEIDVRGWARMAMSDLLLEEIEIIEEKMISSQEIRGEKEQVCTFKIKGSDALFRVVFQNKKVDSILRKSVNPYGENFFVQDFFDVEKLTHYFYQESKERLKLLY